MRRFAPLLLLIIAACAACAPDVDLTTSLQVQDFSTGWYDAGIVNGQNKLVPSIRFKLKNNSDQKLGVLQVQALFRRGEDKSEWGSGFLNVVGSSGLAPAAATPFLTIRSERGYTGSDQSRDEMLHNSQFVDARVELQAKYGSTQWKRIGEFAITRRLLTQ
jgi:hypothetical protein